MWIRYFYISVLLILLGGCYRLDDKEFHLPVTSSEQLVLKIAGENYVDSAQVFFFKKQETKDTLVHREIVYGISASGNKFNFKLPAGYYQIIVFGNVGTDHLVFSPPFSSADILIDYGAGEVPPVVYYTRGAVNVGAQNSAVWGMVLVTSWVELTIKNVPTGIEKIEVELVNTGAGVYLNTNYIEKMTMPQLKSTIYDVKTDSSYTVVFSCFPTVTKLGLSTLEVMCYDAQANLKFKGISAPFTAFSRRKMIISSAFTAQKSNVNKKNINRDAENCFTLYPID